MPIILIVDIVIKILQELLQSNIYIIYIYIYRKCRVGQLEYTNGSHKAIINPGGKSQRRVMTSSTKSRGKQNIRLIFSRNKCKRPGEGSKEQNEHIKREISPDINQNKKEEIKSRENKTNTRNLNNRKNINNVNSSNNCTEILNRWNRFERVRKNDINKDRRMRGYDQPPPQTHEGPRNIRNNTHNTHNTHNINNINNRSGSPPREQEIRDNSEGVGHMRRVVSMEGYPHTQDISNISHPNTSFIDHIIDTNYKSIRVNYNALKRNVESKRRPKPLPPLTKDSIISSVINSMTNSPINSTSSNKHRLIHHNKRKKDLNPNIPMISFEETVNLSRALIGNNTPGGNIYMHTMPIHHEANQLDAGRLPNILSYMNMKRYKINKRKKSEAHRPLWRDVL